MLLIDTAVCGTCIINIMLGLIDIMTQLVYVYVGVNIIIYL